MSITTYRAEILFGGFGGDASEEFFLKLRDAVLAATKESGYWVQHVKLDCHYERCEISQMPDGGMISDDTIRVVPLTEKDSIS